MRITPNYESMDEEDDALRDEAFRRGWVGGRNHDNPDDTPGLIIRRRRTRRVTGHEPERD